MFVPLLKTARKGILNAMANESIPVEIRFPKPVANVTLVLWGSIGSGTPAGQLAQERHRLLAVAPAVLPEQALPVVEVVGPVGVEPVRPPRAVANPPQPLAPASPGVAEARRKSSRVWPHLAISTRTIGRLLVGVFIPVDPIR